jgi:hypothetical protein
MHIVYVSLTKPQHRRLLNGHVVQLKHASLTGSDRIVLDTPTWRKYNRSLKNGKGCRIKLSAEAKKETQELNLPTGLPTGNMQGEGFKDVLKTIKKSARVVARSKLGKQAIRFAAPIVADYAKSKVKQAAYYTERQIEAKLIKAGMPKPLVEQVITTGSTLTPMALNEIDKIGKKLARHGIHEVHDYDIMPVAHAAPVGDNGVLKPPMQLMGQPVVGGRINFRKLFRKIRKFFRPVARALKPLARPLLKAGANALVTGIAASTGNAQLAPLLMPAVNSGRTTPNKEI